MFLKIAFLLFASYCIVNCKYLENWTKMKVKFEPSPALLDGPMRLRVYSTGQMAMPFQIGTPPQQLNLSLNFMLSDVILYSNLVEYLPSSKADPQTYQRNIFDPEASSTFKNYNDEYSCIGYGSGYLASDNMNLLTIGNEAKPMDFMINTKNGEVTNETLVKIPADGILGLGPVGASTVGMKTFPKWIMQKMGRNSAKMTFYFEKFNPQDPNEMAQNSFAMVDLTSKSALPEFCNEQKWFYADKWPMASTSLWMFTAKNIYLQSKNDDFIENLPADGFLGLGPTDASIYGMNTFAKWLLEKMSRNAAKMTFYFEKFNPQDPNEMTQNSFAMVDFTGKSLLPKFCNEQKWFYTERFPFMLQYWVLGAQVSLETKNVNGLKTTSKIIDEFAALAIGMSSFFTIIPEKNMQILAKLLNAKADDRGTYRLSCNATKNAPTMKFEIPNQKEETIFVEFEPKDYILPSNSGNCFLIFKFDNYNPTTYILGYSFFKDHCLQFNLDNNYYQQVGLAPKKFSGH